MSENKKPFSLRLTGYDLAVFNRLQKLFNLKPSDNTETFKRLFMLIGSVVDQLGETDILELAVFDNEGNEKKKVKISIDIFRQNI